MTLLQPDEVLKQRYRVIRLLGRGGMGCVYLAQDQERGLPVAVKSVSISQLDPSLQTRARSQFAHEARMLGHLNHRFLVKAHDHFEEAGEGYIVMSYVEGTDLATVMQERDKPFDFATTLRMMEQLLEALDYLHSQRPPIIFRDLKPRNIMIDPQGDVKLVDFGIARVVEDETLTQSYLRGLGSPGFAPLEQYTHAGTDVRSDIYSLGATIYFLLSNHSPASPMGIVAGDEVLQPLTHYAPGIPAWFNRLVMRTLSLARENRPATARAILQQLKNAGFDEEEATEQISASLPEPEPVAQPPKSGSWRWAVGLALLAGGVFVGKQVMTPKVVASATPRPSPRPAVVAMPDWVQRLQAGQPVRLAAGTYEIPAGIRLTGNVVLSGAGMDQTHIVLKQTPPVMQIRQASICRLEGIDFQYQGKQAGYVVEIGGSPVEISQCRFSGAIRDQRAARGGSGLRMSNNCNGSVNACQANGNAKNGIQVSEKSFLTVANCTCSDNGYAGIGLIGAGEATLENNHCNQNGFGVLLLDRSKAELSNNECRDNDYGLALFDSSQANAEGNLFVGNRKSGWASTSGARLKQSRNRLQGSSQPVLDPALRPR